MDRDDARRLILEGNERERLAAARYLQIHARPPDLPRLREALARETTGWTRLAVESAIERLVEQPGSPRKRRGSVSVERASATDLIAQIRDEVIHQNSLSLVHILDPIVGSLRVHAAKEVQDYPISDTARTIDQLVALLQAMQRLGQASAPPKLSDASIGGVLANLRITEFAEAVDQIRLTGSDSIIWRTDPILVGLIVSPAIRNSLDAMGKDRTTTIDVAWSLDGDAVVIRISDRGIGLPPNPESLFDAGVTMKSRHSGLGLAVARQAAHSLQATI